jgi:hypothetical protein
MSREVEPMRQSAIIFLGAVIAVASVAAAQTAQNAKWLGVWQGELDGQPSVVLTLADDTGELGGTVVLNIIQKENGQARIVALEPHLLMSPHVQGEALAFQFRKPDGNLLDFSVRLTAAGRAKIHCSNCGQDAPIVDLVRAQ